MASVLVENKRSHLAPQNRNSTIQNEINLIAENNTKSIKLSRRNSELLKTVAELLVQRKMVESHSSLQIKEDKGSNGLLIADVARNFVFEVWSHEDKREGVREKTVHRLLRKFPLPNLLVADFDFEFNGRDYLVRQRYDDEISLEAYLQAEEKPFNLSMTDIARCLIVLEDIRHHTLASVSSTRPIQICTSYSTSHTIIVRNKEGGYDFKYEVTSDISLTAVYWGDDVAQILYAAPDYDYDNSYPVYESLADAPDLVERIRIGRKGLNLSADFILTGVHEPYTPPDPIEYTPRRALYPENEKRLLNYIADLLLHHNVLQSRPLLKIIERTENGYSLSDTQKNLFEIDWLYGTEEENNIELAVHRILREEKVPHLITAEFGFQFESYTGLLFRRHCDSLSLYDASRSNKAVMSLRDVLRAVREMSDLFLQYIVPLNHISTARPLSFTARMFDSQEAHIIPNGKGGHDLKLAVNSSYRVMKLADDGVGILIYENDPIDDPHFSLFSTLGSVVEDMGYTDLGELISELDHCERDFKDLTDQVLATGIRILHKEAKVLCG